MTRRIVSLILIPFVLLAQSASYGHSHPGNQPAGHELRAHIHLNSDAEEAHHSHGHPHGPHSHSHENHSHSDSPEQHSPQAETPFDHDSSALYLNSTDLTTGVRSTTQFDLVFLVQWLQTDDTLLPAEQSCSEPEWLVYLCAPPDPAAPLFIRHHAFLI